MRAKILVPLALLLTPALVLAQESPDPVVKWNQIVGVITAPGINNAVAGISSGAGPWSVRDGQARVDLENGQVTFEVRGLVLNGGNSSGTPGNFWYASDPVSRLPERWANGLPRAPFVPPAMEIDYTRLK